MFLLHLIPFHAPVAIAVYVEVFGDWRGGIFMLFLIGLSAGWRRWPQKRAMALTLGYVVLGVVAQTKRERALPGFGDALSWTTAAFFLAFIGHSIGAAFRAATGAAVAAGKAIAGRAYSGVADALAPSPGGGDPQRAEMSAAQARIVAALDARARMETTARARNPARPPAGWTPTVSARRRGLFG